MTSEKQTIGWIDKAKGFAILGVVAVHTVQHFNLSKGITEIAGAGMYCVSLFFIISAFLTFKSFDGRGQLAWTVRNYAKYLGHKIVRLMPVLYIALLWHIVNYTIAIGHLPAHDDNIWTDLLFSALFINGFSYNHFNIYATWYIGILVIFYIFAPLLHRYINSIKKGIIFFAVTMLIGWVLNLILIPALGVCRDDWFFYGWFPHQLPTFAIGIVFYYFTKASSLRSERNSIMVLLFVVAIGFLMSMCTIFSPMEIHIQYGIILLSFTYILFTQRWKCFDWLKPLGNYSYGIYLFHICLLKLFSVATYRLGLSQNSIAVFLSYFILLVALSLLVAFLANKFIEKPFVHLINKRFGL